MVRILLIFYVAVINFPFWIYAPGCIGAPPPKRPRQHTGEVMASELASFKSERLLMKGTGMSLI